MRTWSGVAWRPLSTSVPDKIVYSPHVYGPSLRTVQSTSRGELAYLDDASKETFPSVLRSVWHDHWAFAAVSMGLCVCVGEFGGTGDGNDLTFQSTLVQYLLDSQLSGFMWSLNGNDGHTGGLLDSKWKELRTQKVDLLMRLPASPVATTAGGPKQQPKRNGAVACGAPYKEWLLTLLRAGIRR